MGINPQQLLKRRGHPDKLGLYKKDFPAGAAVELGSNEDIGGPNLGMYTVILVE